MRAALILSALLAVAILPDTVRVSASGNGTRYHAIRCAALAGGGVLVWRVSADSLGYVACKRCLLARPAKIKRTPREVSR